MLLFIAPSQAQTYRHFTTASGMPSNEVYTVFQDKDGYLWFGTDHGLVRYDGNRLITYTTNDGLTDNTIFNIEQDNNGCIWLLTFTGGMCYYDGVGFYPHPQNDSIRALCHQQLPTSMMTLGNMELWLGFNDIGIYQFSANATKAYIPSATVDYNSIYRFKFGPKKTVYAGFSGKTFAELPDNGSWQVNHFNIAQSRIIGHNFNLFPTDGNQTVVAALNQLLILADSETISKYEWGQKVRHTSLKTLADSSTWLTSINSPVYQVSFKNGTMQLIDSLNITRKATNILIDNQGNCWLTTLGEGIYMLPNKNIKQVTIDKTAAAQPISNLQVIDNKLYVGLPESRYWQIDSTMNIATVKVDSTASAPMSFMLQNGGVTTNISETNYWRKRYNNPSLFYISKIVELPNGNTLIGGVNGLMIISPTGILFNSSDMGFSGRVTSMCKLAYPHYIIGTTLGLYYFNVDTKKLVHEKALGETRITSCHTNTDSTFVVTTRGKGMVYFKHDIPYYVNQSIGLISDLAEDCYIENDSTIWVATYKGVCKVIYHFQDGQLYTQIAYYSKEDGICSDEINSIIGYNGYIWLGTNNGLCYFEPESIARDTVLIALSFGNVHVNGVLHSLDSLELEHDQNNILINFNGMYHRLQDNMRYKVRLNSSKWQYITQNSIQYFNLPPAQYKLEIAAESKYGKYRSAIQGISFSISQRFTDTLWFKSIMGGFLIAIIVLIVYAIIAYQRAKVRNQIRYLQAELKALNYQINPHFIFNTLNSIQHFILKKDSKYAAELLTSFSSLIRKIILNARKPYISVLEEVECLKEYMDLEKVRLDNQFDYEIVINSDIDIQKKSVLPMVIQPIVENSIWHGIIPSLKKGKIIITFKKENNRIACTIEDNGIGFTPKNKNDKKKKKNNLSLAMDNVRERLKIIGELNNSLGSFTITHKGSIGGNEKGTIVTITFPTLKHH